MRKETTRESIRRMLEGHSAWHLQNKIEKSEAATKELLSIIPEETVITILRIYRVMTSLGKGKTYRDLLNRDTFEGLEKDFEKIRSILNKHQTVRASHGNRMEVKERWIEKEDIDNIIDFIRERFKQRHRGIETLKAQYRATFKRRKKTTKPPDEPLNIIVYLLSELIRKRKGTPMWKLTLDFLIEQGIIEPAKELTPDNLRQRLRHTTEDDLEVQYDFFRDLYLHPHRVWRKPSQLDQTFFQSMMDQRDIILPPWFDIKPFS